jgi:hypothetical protein
VTSEQARGALLYALTAFVLVAGGLWWVRTAPAAGNDPRAAQWRATAVKLLPDLPIQVTSETLEVSGGRSTDRNEPVDFGSYRVTMLCVGEQGNVRVRVSMTDDDSGRAVPCTLNPATITLTVALADNFYLHVASESQARTVVFRWRLDRVRGF